MAIDVGAKAPDFTLPNQDRQPVTLDERFERRRRAGTHATHDVDVSLIGPGALRLGSARTRTQSTPGTSVP